MKTEALIDMLARGAGPAPRAVVARRLWPVALAGLALSAALSLGLLGPLPGALYTEPLFWAKLAYAVAMALAAGWLAARLARPVARLRGPRSLLLAVGLAMALAGWATLAAAPEGGRLAALLGHSWRACPWTVLGLSLPALAGVLWAVRGLAPTRPQAAGFAAGLLAGALGAGGYALSCSELSPAFVAVWYSAGMLMSAALGAWLGPRVLRW